MPDEREKLKKLLKLFLERALKLDTETVLRTSDIFEEAGMIDKNYRGLQINMSFGKGSSANIPYIAFLGYGQNTQQGIYPVILFYRKLKGVPNLIVSYGVSENNPPSQNWKTYQNLPTIGEYFRKYLSEIKKKKNQIKYIDSYIYNFHHK